MPRKKKQTKKTGNPFRDDVQHCGEITVKQLVEVVSDTREFPYGLDTRICVADVEGNLGVNSNILLAAHKPGDVLLAVDPNMGDEDYDADDDSGVMK